MTTERFDATVEGRPNGGIAIRVPFDPDQAWGEKDRHDVAGSVHGIRIRGRLTVRVRAAEMLQALRAAEGPQPNERNGK